MKASTERKDWEKLQRRNRIVDFAQEIFFSKGYDGATMPGIAESAGYNKRTMYLYFKDKKEIFLAVVLRGYQELYSKLKQNSSNLMKTDSAFKKYAEAFFDFAVNNPGYLDLMMIYESRNYVYYGEPKENENEHAAACQKINEDIVELLTDSLQKGINDKRIRANLTPRQLLLMLWGQVFGVIQIMRIREQYFEKTFEIKREEFFSRFVEMVDGMLSS